MLCLHLAHIVALYEYVIEEFSIETLVYLLIWLPIPQATSLRLLLIRYLSSEMWDSQNKAGLSQANPNILALHCTTTR